VVLHPCHRARSPRAAHAGDEPSLVRAVSVRLLALPFLPQRVRTGGPGVQGSLEDVKLQKSVALFFTSSLQLQQDLSSTGVCKPAG